MKNILIYRPDNIGDAVLFSGALKHIRGLYPESCITLAVQNHICELFEFCPHINKCVPLERLDWVRSTKYPLFVRWIQSAQSFFNSHFNTFDLVVFPVKTPQIEHLKHLYRLKYRNVVGISGGYKINPDIGCPARLAPENLCKKTLDVSGDDSMKHEFMTTIDFLKLLGCSLVSTGDVIPELWLSPSDRCLLENEHMVGRKLVGLFPGAAISYRNWAVANYEILAREVHEDIGYVLFGGKEDRDLAGGVKKALQKGNASCDVLNFVGQTSLRELCAAVKCCDLFVAMETSGLHLAIAMGIPTIGIVGGGHYGRFVPWGDLKKNVFLTKNLDCFNCGWICTRDRVECIQDVSPLKVSESINGMLGNL